jgi:RNA polymerase sigma-70 factor (ECF subfamily)
MAIGFSEILQSPGFFKRVAQGDEKAFKMLFDYYYKHLVIFAIRYVDDKDLSESIVQNVFVKLWEKREALQIDSVHAYLITAVRNQCQNELKHQKIVRAYEKNFIPNEWMAETVYPDEEVMARINQVIDQMPEQRRKIFKMNRLDGMRYKEIADKLEISPKTVEVQIGKALKYLRDNLIQLKQQIYHHN